MKAYNFRYLRVAVIIPVVHPGKPGLNTDEIIKAIETVDVNEVDLIITPELSLTGVTAGDLFFNDDLLLGCLTGIEKIQNYLKDSEARKDTLVLVGSPLLTETGELINASVIIGRNHVLAQRVPITREQGRWFTNITHYHEIDFKKDLGSIRKICISDKQIVNLIDIKITIGKTTSQEASINIIYGTDKFVMTDDEGIDEVKMFSGLSKANNSAIIYVTPGPSESTTDCVYPGKAAVIENGNIISETPSLPSITKSKTFVTDIDLVNLGLQSSAFAWDGPSPFRFQEKLPWVKLMGKYGFRKILSIQSLALQKRIIAGNFKKVVIGISGGSDSTLALMVTANAFDYLGLKPSDIYGITMPCFGTSPESLKLSHDLMNYYGVTDVEIPIEKTVLSHFSDICQSPEDHNLTYENSQARIRTLTLFDYASQLGGALVVGTGDLSEAILGWCTFGGDHLSGYNPNTGLPKTVVLEMIHRLSEESSERLKKITSEILSRPISPELVPDQKSEDQIGPYQLTDFFIYHIIYKNESVERTLALANQTFKDDYTEKEIAFWLNKFYNRYMKNQFKRNCAPDGPQIFEGLSTSPRGGLILPSDL